MIVDLLPTEDQAAIRDSANSALSRSFPVSRLHGTEAFAAGMERAKWSDLAGLGLFGLGVNADMGGIGCTIAEEVTVARELGRFLISPSVLATMLAAHLAPQNILNGIVEGRLRVAFANRIAQGSLPTSSAIDVQLLDAESAGFALIWDSERTLLCPLAKDLPGEKLEAIDETVSLKRYTLDTASSIANQEGSAGARRASLILAAYLTGIAEATVAMAVDYAQTREQFGQPIGAFQAIKHYCAEMARRSEAAASQTFYAAIESTVREDDDLFEAACAMLIAGEASAYNARHNIQIHGGMGFTYEADAHLFLKRALLISQINSGQRQEQMRIMNGRPS